MWKDANLFPRAEQQLADQERSIQQNNLQSDIDLLEIRGSINLATAPTLTVSVNHGLKLNSDAQMTISQTISQIRHSTEAPILAPTQKTFRDTGPQDSELTQEITEQISKLLEAPDKTIEIRKEEMSRKGNDDSK